MATENRITTEDLIRHLERKVASGDLEAAQRLARVKARTQGVDTDNLDVKERAKLLRRRLKHVYGWTAKQVSVRISRYSMGESFSASIKDPNVPLRLVQAEAAGLETVRRCEASGEILGGGNTFFHADYTTEALRPLVDLFAGEELTDGWEWGPLRLSAQHGRGKWLTLWCGSRSLGEVYEDASAMHRIAHHVANLGLLSGHYEAPARKDVA